MLFPERLIPQMCSEFVQDNLFVHEAVAASLGVLLFSRSPPEVAPLSHAA